MTNLERYENAFVETFDIDVAKLREKDLEYNTIDEWDSIGHMSLMAALEDTFDIMLETEDIIEFSSFEKGKEILAKYDVAL